MYVTSRPAPAAVPQRLERLRAAARSVGERIGRAAPVRWMDRHPLAWRLVGGLVLVAAAWHVVSSFVVTYPDEIWQVDLEVYREGAHSLVAGRQVYDWLTDAPQYLPFTYPPFAALVGIPLVLAPFRVVGWVWTAVQIALLWYCTGLAFRPLLARAHARRGLLQGLVAAALVQLQPAQDGIRYGQVNAVIVALCLADVVRRRAGWWPRGSLVGLATAIKLTPAVFWVHWAVTRRWHVLVVSVTAAVTATVVTALVAPSASMAYWTEALLDPNRLGPNADTANQSIRGVLLRLGPHQGPLLTVSWAVCVLVVAVFGYRLSARFERMGESVAVVAVMGMLAFLLSPVSWIHHMYWGIVAIGALLGDGRRLARVAAGAAVYAVLFSRLPWTGAAMLGRRGWRHGLGLVDQQA
ncbi:MAG TPA: glycosyltransferase 87 family protein, partial [Kineosporiaceae bacterium]|nr:glycosyltransferase 87 family protein [Kineosporiaceae bacterium]